MQTATERAARRRLIEQEGRERATAEQAAVSAGVAERVQLGEVRGEAFALPGRYDKRPVRRLTGLESLVRAGKLTEAQWAVGMAYGVAYRHADDTPSPPSCLAQGAGGTRAEVEPYAVMARANGRLWAAHRRDAFRRALGGQLQLVDVLNAVCGEEKTPREVAENGAGAMVVTALLIVALDLLAVARAEGRA
jgi:hypothetical protein